ncbi:MAG: hypothetical protein B7Y59_12680 [Burkholderiales bacterium 35-55-47]|jgi:glycosyltransferase involved in cell wall biosynthesis|nr:MAG: hypothetical protein B7Y59_12680 [Burkholderiales bacterium 35-55-47]OZA98931.1 MAG: hypothetical protein B7X62_12665 [Burkholderiales bacterium 39-55-53]
MKIVHIIVGLNVGGAELMLLRLINQQAKTNKNITNIVVSLTNIGDVGNQIKSLGISVYTLNLRSVFYIPVIFTQLYFLLRRLNPDIVQTWMYHSDFLGGLAARLSGCRRVIWGIRTTDIKFGGSFPTLLIRWFCARLSNVVPDAIICVGFKAKRLHESIGYQSNRMTVIPNGYDFSSLNIDAISTKSLRLALGIKKGALIVGTLGRFNPVKDQLNFVRAAGLIAARNQNVQFIMVGRGCDYVNRELMSWIKATGYADRFQLLGERQDTTVYLSIMDVFVLSSRTEGFPNALVEAMAIERACVSTMVGDVDRILGRCGIIVPPEDNEALAKGIDELLNVSCDQRIRYGCAARKRVTERYSIHKCSDRYIELYNNLMQKI